MNTSKRIFIIYKCITTMMMVKNQILSILIILLFSNTICQAQTEIDGIMMRKKLLCIGVTANQSNWKNYWEGTYKRENLNLGTVSSFAATVMGNYGISDRCNIIFGLPYIQSKASEGQLAPQKNVQDLSMFGKFCSKGKTIGKGEITGILISGFSIPISNYTPDLLPLSIGLQSKTAMVRTMVDYQYKNFVATISSAYIYRGNVRLDRNTYYTTEMHYSNQVWMPNVSNFHIRAGYRGMKLVAEAILDQTNTLGGFDITKNNMPFVSNKMNATRAGIHIKYEVPKVDGLSIVADGMATLAGRNIGQTNMYGGGIFYVMNTSKKNKIK
jgi:hypothetical protein